WRSRSAISCMLKPSLRKQSRPHSVLFDRCPNIPGSLRRARGFLCVAAMLMMCGMAVAQTATPTADLSVTKTDSEANVSSGANTTFTAVVGNGGPATVAGAVLTDPPQHGFDVVQITCAASPGECTSGTTPTAGEIASGYVLPPLAPVQTYDPDWTVKVTATSGDIQNCA